MPSGAKDMTTYGNTISNPKTNDGRSTYTLKETKTKDEEKREKERKKKKYIRGLQEQKT